jgi:hypothetical protein
MDGLARPRSSSSRSLYGAFYKESAQPFKGMMKKMEDVFSTVTKVTMTKEDVERDRRLGYLNTYMNALIHLNAQGVRVLGELNAVMEAINKELGIKAKVGGDKREEVIKAAVDLITVCERNGVKVFHETQAVSSAYYGLRDAVYNLGA